MSNRTTNQEDAAVEFLVDKITNNETNISQAMVVREYRKIGEGAFGTVVQAQLHPYESYTQKDSDKWAGPFAIKRVPAQTEYKSRELEILRITNHPNVIKLMYFFNYKSPQDHKVYQHLAMECLPETLQLEIRRFTSVKQSLPLTHIKIYCYQIARAMLYLHALGICHRDIKPSNILVDPKSGVLKICDFGSAKRLEPNQPSVAYICSRYYRAPELIVGCTMYTTQIDIWGLGCVLGEMFLGRAVFQGSDPTLQLREISKLLGPPDKRFIFNSNPRYPGPLFSKPLFTGKVIDRFQKVFPNATDEGYDLLLSVLQYDPAKRATPVEIMAHSFFDELRSKDFVWYARGSGDVASPAPSFFNFSSFELDLIGKLLPKIYQFQQ
ncbi:serine/threonine/tyrosine protein kinase [Saccharomycopsis crataegensis]|uniref:Serine/threonine/tyrosine protein kinase n=1 Tax=Saccharomycopsis crataegensis TaxID=43959 RepID=A0AAV5QLT5_9ASCO|nr:serine/threonine/tyrosine protein kinase [Saccharomycopsis crataegensis]